MTDATPRLRQTVLDTRDARRAAEFWRQVLGYAYRPGDEPPAAGEPDPKGCDWLCLRTPGGQPALAFQQTDTLPRATWPDPAVPQQLHLDLSVPTPEALAAAHTRILSLGGTELYDRSGDPVEPLRVYADPDGHPFCVFVASD